MPKGFSEREKAIIREKLLEKGRECFATYGIRKTSVEELTDAAGISKGAFYLFFDSKELLFFEILGQFEAAYHDQMVEVAAGAQGSPRERIKQFLTQAFSAWRTNPLFTHFNQEEFEYLARKLPEEALATTQSRDDLFAERLFEVWRGQGIQIDLDARTYTGLIRALFFVGLHARGIGQEAYPDVLALLIDMVADRVVKQ
jgi:AcrR family transcriptional regulator